MTSLIPTPAGTLRTRSTKPWHVITRNDQGVVHKQSCHDHRGRALAAWRRACREMATGVDVWLIHRDGTVEREREGVKA